VVIPLRVVTEVVSEADNRGTKECHHACHPLVMGDTWYRETTILRSIADGR
jgi:hypothetical protein